MKELTIAHLTDLHLNGSSDRRERFTAALKKASTFKPDHLVLTGDLTKNGRTSHFDELASCLAGWSSERVTIVPGNHDEGSAFDRSMISGPLSRFERTSRRMVVLEGLRILPLDTRFHRRALAFKAIGAVGQPQMESLASALSDPSPLLVVQHHGPQFHPLHVFDGLTDRGQQLSLLARRPDVHVLAGHDHRILDHDRVHVAASVAHHPDPLRIYHLLGASFRPGYKSGDGGDYLTFGALPWEK